MKKKDKMKRLGILLLALNCYHGYHYICDCHEPVRPDRSERTATGTV